MLSTPRVLPFDEVSSSPTGNSDSNREHYEDRVRERIRRGGAHTAEELRATYAFLELNDEADKLATRCSFHPWEAIKSFAYELTPPIFISPLLCVLLEPSVAQGINVARHRQYFPSLQAGANPPLGTLIDNVLHWFVTAAVLLWLASPSSNVDKWELLLAYSWMCVRWAVIGTKYGHYTENLLNEMRKPVDSHNEKLLTENLILISWASPAVELLRKISKDAQDIADVNLNTSYMRFGSHQTETFLQLMRRCHSQKEDLSTPSIETGGVTAGDVLLQLLTAGFTETLTAGLKKVLLCGIVVMAFFPCSVRLWFGIEMFGSTYVDHFIYIGMFLSQCHGAQSSLMFCLTAALDLKRRLAVLNMLGQMAQYPGVEFRELFGEAVERPTELPHLNSDEENGNAGESKASQPTHLYLDLEDDSNAYLWLLLRRSVRVAGYHFYVRGMSYIGICVSWAIAASAVLNFIVWTESYHHMASIGSILIGILAIMLSVQIALQEATALQELIPSHRLTLKRKLVIVNQELMELETRKCSEHNAELRSSKNAWGSTSKAAAALFLGSNTRTVTRLKALQELLKSIEECLSFEEEVTSPVQVFGIPAGRGLTGAVFGTVVAGVSAAAMQEYAAADLVENYDHRGWFRSQGN